MVHPTTCAPSRELFVAFGEVASCHVDFQVHIHTRRARGGTPVWGFGRDILTERARIPEQRGSVDAFVLAITPTYSDADG